MTAPTRYVFEISCEDIGEYDAVLMSSVVSAIAELLGASGIGEYVIRTERRRPGPFS